MSGDSPKRQSKRQIEHPLIRLDPDKQHIYNLKSISQHIRNSGPHYLSWKKNTHTQVHAQQFQVRQTKTLADEKYSSTEKSQSKGRWNIYEVKSQFYGFLLLGVNNNSKKKTIQWGWEGGTIPALSRSSTTAISNSEITHHRSIFLEKAMTFLPLWTAVSKANWLRHQPDGISDTHRCYWNG